MQASYDPGDFRRRTSRDQYGERSQSRYGEHSQYGEPGEYPPDVEYEDEYEAGRRFVPGFGDDGDADYENVQPDRRSRRDSRRDSPAAGGAAAVPGAGSAGSRRWSRC